MTNRSDNPEQYRAQDSKRKRLVRRLGKLSTAKLAAAVLRQLRKPI